jgi:cytoskeletal protein CcmA (bactofilin family)
MALFGKSNNKQAIPNHKTTIIAEGTRFKGELNLVCELFVDGEIEGIITSDHEVTVGINGRINGDVTAEKVVIHGKVDGNIDANRVYVQSDGEVKGTIESNELIIESKGVFQGESKIKTLASKQPVEKHAKKSSDDKS